MSARQPFVPQRTVSNNSDPKTNSNSNTESQSLLDLGTNKPLNLSGFIKPKSSNKHQQQQNHQPNGSETRIPTLKSCGSSFDGVQRPVKPAIFSKNRGSIKLRMSNNSMQQQNQSQNQNKTVQPPLFLPTSSSTPTSGFLSMSSNSSNAFEGPPLFQLGPRSSSNSNSGPNTNANMNSGDEDAHISTFPQLPTESALTMTTPDLRSSLEKSQEPEPSVSPFGNRSRSKESLLSNSVDLLERSSSPSAVGSVGSTGLGFGVGVSGGAASLGLGIAVGAGPGWKKRDRVEDEEGEGNEQGHDAGTTTKRRKDDGGQIEYTSKSRSSSNVNNPHSNASNKQQQRNNSHQHYYRELSAQIQDTDELELELEQRHTNPQQPLNTSHPLVQPQPQPQTQEHALLTLLGTDLDSYVAHHIEEYEAEKVKWTGCKTEVWVKGADELAAEFTGLLDFVKNHMTTKLSMYATLNQKVRDHKTILSERAKVLEDVQRGLLKDGAVLI